MADFTLELRDVIKYAGSEDVGLSTYPIFNPNYREHLNQKILNHYWFNEIGLETVDQFVFQLNTRMHEIMPYYNQLYESTLLDLDPTKSVNMVTELVGNTKTVNSGETTSNSDVTEKSSNTSKSSTDSKSQTIDYKFPQTRLSGREDYATNGVDVSNNADTTGSGESSGNSSQSGQSSQSSQSDANVSNVSKTHGNNMPVGSLLNNLRESFINIDMMVISELADLFMLMYNTGDDYTQRGYYGRF